jgi:hypothetical protein
MKTKWIYIKKPTTLGWGIAEIEVDPPTYKILDFEPQLKYKADLRYYWKNRYHILALPKMSLWKYTKTLIKGLIIYNFL